MPRYDFRSPRLFIDTPLDQGAALPLEPPQAHYLADVLRLKEGDGVLVFNGRDGEWGAALAAVSKKKFALHVTEQTRAQTAPTNLHYLFAPIKRARLDYMVQKAVEMGASKLAPVITRHTNAERVNVERMRANAIEAAEQCGILCLPEIAEPTPFARALSALEPGRLLVFCDEEAEARSPLEVLSAERRRPGEIIRDVGGEYRAGQAPTTPAIAVIIGPEGGFSDDERQALLARPNSVRLSLGPRILRADTAGVAALAVVQAVLGDWQA
ncbi:MAG: 16S rRNA (uracil(1498)-N(3))-methyltransferase [Xanthobacteraceae bacterium]